ncbi:MAG: hypothetical protein C5B52_12355 [Bacteroidetes bacterium]|nr:MAG: hypothetical protein C5B52_12355 [Bacteroidota bacterium]
MKRFQENTLMTAIALIITGVLIVLIFSFDQRKKITEIAARLEFSHQVLTRISNFYNTVVLHAGSTRNYALSGNIKSIDSVESSSSSLLHQLNLIKKDLYQIPEQKILLDSLTEYLYKRVDLSAQIIDLGARKGQQAASVLYQTGLGRDYNNRILAITNEMQSLELSRLENLEHESSSSLKQLGLFLVGLLVTILALILVIILKVRLDLKEKKKAEIRLLHFNEELQKQVREKTAELTDIFERISDAFVALNKDFQFSYINKKASELIEKNPKLLLGKSVFDEFSSDAIEPLEKAIRKSMGEQTYQNLEAFYHANQRWIEYHLYPAEEGISIFFRDISEKKQIENALRDSEQKYRSLIEQALDAIMITDFEGRFLDMNSSTCNMFGYTKEELLKISIVDLIEKESLSANPPRFDLIAAGVSVERARRFVQKNGQIFDAEYNASRLGENKTMIFIRNVSELRKVQREIQISEARFRGAFEFSGIAMGLVGLDGKWLKVNHRLTQITGYNEKELLDMNWKDVIHPEDYANDSDLYIRAREEKLEPTQIDERFVHKNGNIVWINITTAMIEDENGQPLYFVLQMEDITERKKIEMELREAEAKFRNLVERSLVGVYILQDNKYVYANPKFAEIFGYELEEVSGKLEVEKILKEEDHERIAGYIESRMANNPGTIHYELTGVKKTGEHIQLEIFGSRTIYGGRPAVIGTLIDISERKELDEKIRKEKVLAESIINSMPGVFFVHDGSSSILRWNKQLESISGYTPEELRNMSPIDFFDGNDRKIVENSIREIFETGSSSVEATAITKSKDRIPFYFTGHLISFEGVPSVIGTGIDISQRLQIEKDLRESEQKYKLLFESNPMPMLMFSNDDHRIIDINQASVIHYGYSREEFLEMKLEQIKISELEQTALNGTGDYESERVSIWKNRTKEGSTMLEEVVGHDIIYQGKDVRLILCNDVTEKIVAEEKLKQSYAEIRMLTKHLQKIREEERTHIAREIHDELGQQLTVLKMDASWLQKKLAPTDVTINEKLKNLRDLLDATVKSVRRISSELRPSLLDDLGLVAAIKWHLKEFERRSGIETEFLGEEFEPSLPEEIKTGLFRIYQESLTNVARHADAARVEINLEQNDGNFVLRIKDDGKGFDLAHAADKKTLGLLGMKERSSMMEGSYQIMSEPGSGTVVTVSVPYEN